MTQNIKALVENKHVLVGPHLWYKQKAVFFKYHICADNQHIQHNSHMKNTFLKKKKKDYFTFQ